MKKFDPKEPYNDLPLLPPIVELETKTILRKVASARAALAEMKGMGEIIPNQAMLVNSLTLCEAKDSSEIENIVTTRDELFIAFATQHKNISPQIKEVLNYRSGLWHGYNLIKEKGFMSVNVIIDLHEKIINNDAGIRKFPGTALKNSRTGEIVYTPPTGEINIKKKLSNLETYINIDDDVIDALIKMAIIHYQFESIHPFYDGNGRVGRIINILYLVMKGLLDIPILYLSSYIIKRKPDYYKLLSEVRFDDRGWEKWILFLLDGVEQTAKQTSLLIKEIKKLLDETIEKVKSELPSIYSKELVETLFEHPYCKVSFLVEKGLYERRTAMKNLNHLEKIGILRSIKRGKQKLFLNTTLFELFKDETFTSTIDN
ncbi:MAG: Fic family protein [Bacteroidales bacterium]|nr:Fic family protein [Bacteroidales bacterium]